MVFCFVLFCFVFLFFSVQNSKQKYVDGYEVYMAQKYKQFIELLLSTLPISDKTIHHTKMVFMTGCQLLRNAEITWWCVNDIFTDSSFKNDRSLKEKLEKNICRKLALYYINTEVTKVLLLPLVPKGGGRS